MSWDAVIVGGGVAGGVFAARMARNGRRILVLEARRETDANPRAEVLWPATLRRLAGVLEAEDLERICAPVAGVELDLGGGPRPLVPPRTFEQLGWRPSCADAGGLRERLLCRGAATVRRGARVVRLLRASERVVGVLVRDEATGAQTEEIARLVVGDDGPTSFVRESCGIALVGLPSDLEFRAFRFRRPDALPPGVIRVFSDAGRADSSVVQLLALPLPEGAGAGVLVTRRGRASAAALAQFLDRHPAAAEAARGLHWTDVMTNAPLFFGHAARYGMPGVALLGDAAHPTVPSGAQGANMAVADACALAQAYERGDDGLLERYEAMRRGGNARAQAFARRCSPAWALPAGRASAVFYRLGVEVALAWPRVMREVVVRANSAFIGLES